MLCHRDFHTYSKSREKHTTNPRTCITSFRHYHHCTPFCSLCSPPQFPLLSNVFLEHSKTNPTISFSNMSYVSLKDKHFNKNLTKYIIILPQINSNPWYHLIPSLFLNFSNNVFLQSFYSDRPQTRSARCIWLRSLLSSFIVPYFPPSSCVHATCLACPSLQSTRSCWIAAKLHPHGCQQFRKKIESKTNESLKW